MLLISLDDALAFEAAFMECVAIRSNSISRLTWSLTGRARDVQISTSSLGLNANAVLIEGEETDPSAVVNGDRQLAYLPSEASVHHLWYRGHWVRVTRIIRQGQGYYSRREEALELWYVLSILMSIPRPVIDSTSPASLHGIIAF